MRKTVKKIMKWLDVEIVTIIFIFITIISCVVVIEVSDYKTDKKAYNYAIEKNYTVKDNGLIYTFYDSNNHIVELIGRTIIEKW